jgi:hypothetical protein
MEGGVMSRLQDGEDKHCGGKTCETYVYLCISMQVDARTMGEIGSCVLAYRSCPCDCTFPGQYEQYPLKALSCFTQPSKYPASSEQETRKSVQFE